MRKGETVGESRFFHGHIPLKIMCTTRFMKGHLVELLELSYAVSCKEWTIYLVQHGHELPP